MGLHVKTPLKRWRFIYEYVICCCDMVTSKIRSQDRLRNRPLKGYAIVWSVFLVAVIASSAQNQRGLVIHPVPVVVPRSRQMNNFTYSENIVPTTVHHKNQDTVRKKVSCNDP